MRAALVFKDGSICIFNREVTIRAQTPNRFIRHIKTPANMHTHNNINHFHREDDRKLGNIPIIITHVRTDFIKLRSLVQTNLAMVQKRAKFRQPFIKPKQHTITTTSPSNKTLKQKLSTINHTSPSTPANTNMVMNTISQRIILEVFLLK
ncbi:hypothetical protein ACOSQ2_031215 [Xanthoceras sorbifolium]